MAELVARFHAQYPAVSFTVCHDLFGQERQSFDYDIRVTAAGQEETDGSLTLWPQRHGTDGFYLCKMEKK